MGLGVRCVFNAVFISFKVRVCEPTTLAVPVSAITWESRVVTPVAAVMSCLSVNVFVHGMYDDGSAMQSSL